MNWKYVLIVVILTAIVGGGIWWLTKEKAELPEAGAPEKIPAGELKLTIDIPKTSFVTGEQIEGKYIVENEGDPFEGYVLEKCTKKGYEKNCRGRGISLLGKYSGILDACEITERGAMCMQDSFSSPGMYVFELAVYDCAEIEEVLGVACNEARYSGVTTRVQPLSAIKKVVTVTGEIIKPECEDSDDCTQICEGCVEGKYICVFPKQECVQCVTDRYCKSGYNCEHYECIKSEKTCTEYGGVDCSSTRACINGEWFRAIDIDYCCTGSCR